jgi:uncharacterized protein (TIGR02996 family)
VEVVMNQQESLFRAILDEPWDDAHRLVYADWLEDNDQADRGRFIRVQVALAKLLPDDPRIPALQREEKRLAQGRRTLWKAEVPKLKGITWGDFRRGFLDKAVFHTAYRFRMHARQVVSSAPIEVVQVRSLSSLLALAGSPHLARVRELILDGARPRLGMDQSGIFMALADAEHLGRLKRLSLRDDSLDRSEVRSLAGAKVFPSLEELDMGANFLQDDTIRYLVGSASFGKLRRLNLAPNSFSDAGKQTLREKFGERVVL